MNMEHEQPWVTEVTEGNFENEVLKATQPTLVAFGASWSKPCQLLKTVLNDVAGECTGTFRVLRVNVDDNPDLGLWYGIESIPTLLCFVQGKVRGRIVGTVSKEAILTRLHTLSANP